MLWGQLNLRIISVNIRLFGTFSRTDGALKRDGFDIECLQGCCVAGSFVDAGPVILPEFLHHTFSCLAFCTSAYRK